MLIIGNGTVITHDPDHPLLEDGAIAVRDGVIQEIGPTHKLKQRYPQASFIEAKNKIVMPGMINSHMHFYSYFALGMDLKTSPPQNFTQILEKLWWRLDKVLQGEDIYYSTLVAAIEGIKNGTTTFLDHHAGPGAITGSLDQIARACNELGIRASLAYEVSDRDGEEAAQKGIEENIRFFDRCQGENNPLIASSFGLHASFTLSDSTLEKCREAAGDRSIGYHIHTAEGKADREASMEKHGMPVVKRLDKWGVWNDLSLAIHGVYIDEEEMDILQGRDTAVIHNPESNMGNAVGRAPVLRMLEKGLLVGMGTDGYTTDMFEGIKVANLLHKHGEGNPSAAWGEIQEMAFANNIEIVERQFRQKIGVIAPGNRADIIILDYKPRTPLTAENYYMHILMGISGRMVETVLVDGRVLLENRELVGLDEEKIFRRARERAQRVWKEI